MVILVLIIGMSMEHVKILGYAWNFEKVVLIPVGNFSVGNACSIYEFGGNVAERLRCQMIFRSFISNAIIKTYFFK